MLRDIAIVLVGFAAFVALALWSVVAWNDYRCPLTWPDFETRYSFATGCQVRIDGRWIRQEFIREFEPIAEGPA